MYLNDKKLGHTVVVEMFGVPADTLKGQRALRTKMTSATTFNVKYSESTFTFRKVCWHFNCKSQSHCWLQVSLTCWKIIMPELAMLSLTALDEQNKFIGYRLLPIIGLRSGYRYICLRNESNQSLNMCMILVNLTVKDYVPNKFAGTFSITIWWHNLILSHLI